MAATPPSNSKSPGNDRHSGEQSAPLTFEENLNQFWQKNRMIVLGLCAVVLLAILAKAGWEYVQRQHEANVEREYAMATTPDQLRAFVNAHPDHELAGVAAVQVADQAYTSGKAADAVTEYDKAIAVLKKGPLASRARLGRALAEVQSGKQTEGESDLKQIANDATEFKAVRAEAAYQLASLAVEARNYTDVQKYIEQLNQIDPASVWARRAVSLQANLPKSASLAAPVTTPSTSTAVQAGPSVQVKLPGK